MASAVSIWVGGDGYTNGDPVVQAGVDIILDEDGDATYKAWTEVKSRKLPPNHISKCMYTTVGLTSRSTVDSKPAYIH